MSRTSTLELVCAPPRGVRIRSSITRERCAAVAVGEGALAEELLPALCPQLETAKARASAPAQRAIGRLWVQR
ncbi:MAG: hypothetical protein M3016_01020 [Actinomycetota bacterium]|nr:hypothetical protein [Actinomycetota bacterium]